MAFASARPIEFPTGLCETVPGTDRPSRVMAILPFAVLEGGNVREQAELCYGITCFLHRRLAQVGGFETVVHHAAQPHDSRTGDRGQSVGWSAEALAMSLPEGWEPTHLLRGRARWDEDGLAMEVELIDLQASMGLLRDSAEGSGVEAVGVVHALLAEIAERLGDAPHAPRLLRRIPTRSPEAFRHFLTSLAAAENWRRGMADADRPLKGLLAALREDSDYYGALTELLALAEEALRDADAPTRKAVRSALEEALRMLPAEAGLAAQLGLLLESEPTESRRAAELLLQALRSPLEPALASRCHQALAALATRAGNRSVSLARLELAVGLDPDNVRAWAMLGDCRRELGARRAAEDAWRRSLRISPDQPVLLASVAACHLERREELLAREMAERALALDPEQQIALAVLTRCCLRAGDFDEADEVATSWAERHPELPVPWMAVGEARWHRGDHDAARYAFDRAAALCAVPAQRESLALIRLALEDPEGRRLLARIQALPDDILREEPDVVSIVRERLRTLEGRQGIDLVVERERARLERLAQDTTPVPAVIEPDPPARAESPRQAEKPASGSPRPGFFQRLRRFLGGQP